MALPVHSLPIAVCNQFSSSWKTPFMLSHAHRGKERRQCPKVGSSRGRNEG